MTFDEVLKEATDLAKAIEAAGFQPQLLVGLARGGWIPTRLLSGALGVKEIVSIGMKYTDAARTVLATYSTPAPMPSNQRLLLIEDCLESGLSMAIARDILISAGNSVKTAALFVTSGTIHLPDFYNRPLNVAPRFPWE